jgi:hypothetical protein
MKKLFLSLAVIAAFAFQAEAQRYVNDDRIDEEAVYLSVVGFRGTMGRSMSLFLDFGQWDGSIRRHEFKTLDQKPIVFQNTMELVNFLAKHGWELAHANFEMFERPKRTDHYVMKRKQNMETAASKANLEDVSSVRGDG